MSKTFKTDLAYRNHKDTRNHLFTGDYEDAEFLRERARGGRRYGNQRKMRAEMKVTQRRLDRRQREREAEFFME